MNLEKYERDIETAIQTDQLYDFESEDENQLARRLELKQGWTFIYARDIANAVFARRHAEHNPSLPSDTTDSRLLDLIRDLNKSNTLLPVLRGLPRGVWMDLYNAVTMVADGG